MRVITNNFEETQKAGEEFASQLEDGDVLLLFGDLGAGKTTFVQGLAKGLGIKRRIISPTFIIIRRYELDSKMFYHIDLYRTETEDDLKGLGLQEVLEDKQAIVAIEWPEKLGSFLPKKRWEIVLKTIDENKREIIMEKLVSELVHHSQ